MFVRRSKYRNLLLRLEVAEIRIEGRDEYIKELEDESSQLEKRAKAAEEELAIRRVAPSIMLWPKSMHNI